MAIGGGQITRLGLMGTPTQLYGSFAGKAAALAGAVVAFDELRIIAAVGGLPGIVGAVDGAPEVTPAVGATRVRFRPGDD